ncbi:L,D-transpeptidase [Flavisphingomonas formosensis]|uniref:L,D-transpeptidase n=1 Tax=Flavisphingomonas formosensis TaxID=861534 RepID=UPI0012F8A073|nr:L,D-transpeptidase [Sphingomonas formosensis]
MTKTATLWTAALAAQALVAASAFGQGATVSSLPELARKTDALKPGEWIWAPGIAPSGPVLVYVDLSRQRATVYRNGVRIGVSTVSSGKQGYETPTGVFTILQKDADHRSSKYNSAPMPFTQRLTWDGVALHAGGLPGYPESHGCVHLPMAFAKALFGITSLGATVVVEGNAVNHVTTTDASLLVPPTLGGADATAQQSLDRAEYRWQPEKAPTGPLTIIISKSDQAIVVLRNGVEIGRSVARINDDDPGSHVINLALGKDGKPHWIYVGLPGHDGDVGRELDEAAINRVLMPRAFYDAVKAELRPGTTILVTMSSVGEGNMGEQLTILDAVNPRP